MTGVAKHAEKYFKDDSARGGSLRSSGGSSSSSSSSSLASSDDRKPGMEKKASGGGGGSTVGSPTAGTAAAAVGVRTRVVSGVLERNTELERENRDLKRQLRQAQEQMALLKCQLEMGAKVSATISPRDGDGEALASGESMGEGKLSNLVEESAKADRARADAWEQLKKTLKSARERFDAAKASPRAVAAGGGNSDDDPEGKD